MSRWDDSIRVHLEDMCVSTMNWIDLAHDRDYLIFPVNAAFNIRVP